MRPIASFIASGAALELIGLLERRVDQHDRALFLHRQQGPRDMPAFAQVHGRAGLSSCFL
jgi:hypothetical protein